MKRATTHFNAAYFFSYYKNYILLLRKFLSIFYFNLIFSAFLRDFFISKKTSVLQSAQKFSTSLTVVDSSKTHIHVNFLILLQPLQYNSAAHLYRKIFKKCRKVYQRDRSCKLRLNEMYFLVMLLAV